MSSDNDEIWHTYASDGADALRTIEESLLRLETDPSDKPEVNRLYRALHTLKGNSAFLELTQIEILAHAAEDMIGLVRDRGVALDASMIELLLALRDRLHEIVGEAGDKRRDVEPERVADLLERVRTRVQQHGGLVSVDPTLVGRGQLVIWSNLPASGSSLAPQPTPFDDFMHLELFLGLCREKLPDLLDLSRTAADAQARVRLGLIAEELSLAAVNNGQAHVAQTLNVLSTCAQRPEVTSTTLGALATEVVAAAGRAELAYRATCATPQDFNLVTMHELLCAAAAGPMPELAQRAEPHEAPTHNTLLVPLRAAKGVLGPLSQAPKQPAPIADKTKARDAEEASREGGATKTDFLRIDARKVSLVMDLAGEIALAASAVTQHPDLEGLDLTGFASASHKLDLLIKELLNEVSAMRLVPVSGVFQRMNRVVRDTARRTEKKVELTLVGEETEIDKLMVDCLPDPLVHVVRNAIDHGIESPAERIAAGKPEVGRVVLSASHQGGEVAVRVTDDGRGMNRRRILARAIERGLVGPEDKLSDEQIVNLVFLPGFSTKETIDELSGRGVGMDVLKTTVEGLRGRVRLTSVEGKGSTLEISLPLTLAFVEAMVVREQERLFAVPIEKVCEVFKASPEQLCRNSAEGQTLLRLRENLIPVVWLHRFYGEPDNDVNLELDGRVIVVVQSARGAIALPVDKLLGNQPVMLKPLTGLLSGIRAAAGCGMLRSGDVALALDCESLQAHA